MKKTTGILAIAILTMSTLTGCGVNTSAVNMGITSVETTVNQKVAEVPTSNVAVEETVEDDRKYIFIGDSYGSGHTDNDGMLTPWTTYLPSYLGLEEEDYYKMAVPGAGFIKGNHSGRSFLHQLKYVTENNMRQEDKNEITDIVVLGGYNDLEYSTDEIESAIASFCAYAKENYPNATVRIGAVGWTTDDDNKEQILKNSVPAYKKVVNYGGTYLYNTEFLARCQDNFVSDGIHPNQSGQIQISRGVAEALVDGSCHIPENVQ